MCTLCARHLLGSGSFDLDVISGASAQAEEAVVCTEWVEFWRGL